MHLKAPRLLWVLPLLLPLACKDPETVAVQSRDKTAQEKLDQGRNLLASGQPELAARVLSQASGLMPDRTEPLLLLADAHRRAGNSGAAILALKQAMVVSPSEAPDIKRKLAERYEQDGHLRQSIDVLLELRDAEHLGDMDILKLAHLQTLEGQHEAAFSTLERIQSKRPDDVDAKVVEAEILLAKGEEVLAARLMDRLLTEQPALTSARVLRARYFLQSGFSEYAEQDLAQLQGDDAVKPEVLTLKARVLEALGRHAEAETFLTDAVARYPQNADLIARLAETKLQLGKQDEVRTLVERALQEQPDCVRALYVRAHALELQGDLRRAKEDYAQALGANARFAPALKRMWRLQKQVGEDEKALSSLERLVEVRQATLEEKVALAELYAKTHLKAEQGLKLIGEALKQEPDNFQYLDIQKKNLPRKKRSSGPVIMRGGR
jgi:tetratricopeptide (TPR) repeat protein